MMGDHVMPWVGSEEKLPSLKPPSSWMVCSSGFTRFSCNCLSWTVAFCVTQAGVVWHPKHPRTMLPWMNFV